MDIKLQNLKNKLSLKWKRIEINKAVNWNFGYYPRNSKRIDKLLEEVLRLEVEVLLVDAEWYGIYERKYCGMK